jgi:diguanylate cyclase (GGDEF)-like protein
MDDGAAVELEAGTAAVGERGRRAAGPEALRRFVVVGATVCGFLAFVVFDALFLGDGSFATLRIAAYTTVVGVLLYVLADLERQVIAQRTRLADLDVVAGTDPVTGVANRRHAVQVLEHHLGTAQRYGRPLAVALLDLDRFKAVNDLHGHAFGDDVLVRVVRALQADLRAVDTLARWGGDELLVIAPETRLADIERSADRWRRLVAGLGISAGQDRPLTVSVGITVGVAGDDVDTLVLRADRALYGAKDAGRDHTVTR